MAKGADIRNLEVYQDAMILERMTYRTEHKIMNKYKKLWKDIIDEASAICDGLSDAYFIPKEQLVDKFNAASFSMSHLVRIERKLDISNSPDVQAISNDVRAAYDRGHRYHIFVRVGKIPNGGQKSDRNPYKEDAQRKGYSHQTIKTREN